MRSTSSYYSPKDDKINSCYSCHHGIPLWWVISCQYPQPLWSLPPFPRPVIQIPFLPNIPQCCCFILPLGKPHYHQLLYYLQKDLKVPPLAGMSGAHDKYIQVFEILDHNVWKILQQNSWDMCFSLVRKHLLSFLVALFPMSVKMIPPKCLHVDFSRMDAYLISYKRCETTKEGSSLYFGIFLRYSRGNLFGNPGMFSRSRAGYGPWYINKTILHYV